MVPFWSQIAHYGWWGWWAYRGQLLEVVGTELGGVGTSGWGPERWRFESWGLERWQLESWGLERWQLESWGLERWQLESWGTGLMGTEGKIAYHRLTPFAGLILFL